MKTEFEIRFLEIDVDDILQKLSKVNAKYEGKWLQKRKTYDLLSKNNNSWLRLRTNGQHTTLAIKEIKSSKVDGTKELEVVVSDFATMDEMLVKMGFNARNYQENYRIRYILDNCEIDIDSWPLIPEYMEIEGPNEKAIINTCKKIGLDYNKATTMDVVDIYNKIYGIDILSIKELKLN